MNAFDEDVNVSHSKAEDKAARRQRKKEKRDLKEAKRSVKALRAITGANGYQSTPEGVDSTMEFADPSSRLLLEAAEHIRRNPQSGTTATQNMELHGPTPNDGTSHGHGGFMSRGEALVDQSNIDPSLRYASQLPPSTHDAHGQQLLDWHEKQRTGGVPGQGQQMRTVLVEDGVYAMVPQRAGLANGAPLQDRSFPVSPYPSNMTAGTRAIVPGNNVLRPGKLTSPNGIKAMSQAAAAVELQQRAGDGISYNMPVEDVQEDAGVGSSSNRKSGKTKKVPGASSKRKRQSDVGDGQDAHEDTTEPAQKRGKGNKVAVEPVSTTAADGSTAVLPTTGPFVQVEIDTIERVVQSFRRQTDMSEVDLNKLVQDKQRGKNPVRDDFWQSIYDALPKRQHVAVQRTARRRYHNFESRGKWTLDEDETLKAMHAQYPQKWVKIGAIMGRMPEDCRDRWRNYLVAEINKRGVEWTQREEMELSLIVQECASLIRKDAKAKAEAAFVPFEEEDWNSLVNFHTVSERMGHSRSRLQCYQHWRLMQRREIREEAKRGESPKNMWRMKSAGKNYKKMTPRDKVAILYGIAGSDTLEEHRIPWKHFRRTAEDAKWTTMDRKVAYMKMKKLVPPQPTLQETVEKLLVYFETHHKRQIENPDQDDVVSVDEEVISEEEPRPNKRGGRKKGITNRKTTASKKNSTTTKGKGKAGLSAEKVVDSDEELEAEEAADAVSDEEDHVLGGETADRLVDLEEEDDEPTSGQAGPEHGEDDEEEDEEDDDDVDMTGLPSTSQLFVPETSEIGSEVGRRGGTRERTEGREGIEEEREGEGEEEGEDVYEEELEDVDVKSEDDSKVGGEVAAAGGARRRREQGGEEGDTGSIVL